jgi:hypothetical protein
MFNKLVWPFTISVLAGFVVAIASVQILGVTSAVAIPSDFYAWFRELGSLETGIFISELVLICGTVGLLSFSVLTVVYRFMFPATGLSFFSFLFGVFLTAYIAIPLYYGMPISTPFARHWWGYSFEISIIFASVAAYLLARRLGHNYAIKGTSV